MHSLARRLQRIEVIVASRTPQCQREAFAWFKTRAWPKGASADWRYERCRQVEGALAGGYTIASKNFVAFCAAQSLDYCLGLRTPTFAGEDEATAFHAVQAEAELAVSEAVAAHAEWPRWL